MEVIRALWNWINLSVVIDLILTATIVGVFHPLIIKVLAPICKIFKKEYKADNEKVVAFESVIYLVIVFFIYNFIRTL